MTAKAPLCALAGLFILVGQAVAVETTGSEAAISCAEQARQAGLKDAEDISEFVHECVTEQKARQSVEKPDVRTVSPDSEGV